jgi:hypothetical protein
VRGVVRDQRGPVVAVLVALLAADRRPEVAEPVAQLPRHLRQPLGSEDQQGDHEDEQQVRRLEDVANHRRHLLYPCRPVIYDYQPSGELPGPSVPSAPVAGWPVELADPPPEPAPPPEVPPAVEPASEPREVDAAVALDDDADGPELTVVSEVEAAGGAGVV